MTNLSDDYEDQEEQLGKRFEDLCVDLCIEGTVKEEAWDKYKDVSSNFCIDGDQLQWLVCALYECVRKSTTDNINSLDNTYVSLARLLSASKMSFVQFFHRIRKWADMIEFNVELRDRIERIESQFSVSSVIFDKFIDAFYMIFQKYDNLDDDVAEEKFKIHYTDEELFRFIWILYIKIKTNFPAICGDIILSFQLLLCTLDWVASNAIVSKAKYIFNPTFKGLPADFFNRSWKPHDRFPSVLKFVCESNDMNYIDCKSTRDSYFRGYVEKLLEKEVIKGREGRDDNVLNSVNFEFNSRALLNLYAEYMMASGDFDERIYLNANAGDEIGSVSIARGQHELSLNSELTPNAVRYMQEVINCGGNIPGSVDTRRPVPPKQGKFPGGSAVGVGTSGIVSRLNGGINFNNYDSRVMNSNYLITFLSKKQACASEELTDMMQTHCFPSPLEEIQTRLEKMSYTFLGSYNDKYIDLKMDLHTIFQKKQFDPSLQRCQTVHKLYYMALENILKAEVAKIELRYKMRSRSSDIDEIKLSTIDISSLLKKEDFHTSLFAICMEIVLVSSDSSKHFPWILEVMDLQALHFYKIAEIFMRCVDLPRELVKYFNQVTENIVDSYAWRSVSVLWTSLARSGKSPSIDEVTPPERIELSFKGNKKLIVESNRDRSQSKSSMITSRRMSGSTNTINTNVITQSSSVAVTSAVSTSVTSFRHDDDESARAAAHLLSANADDDKTSAVAAAADLNTTTVVAATTKPFSIRHDSLALFFRQMYFLSSLRLRDLCDRLHINRELMCKIWTTFEHVIIDQTHLLRDRCLDQVIICCVYAVTKVASNRLISFHEIIQMYRMQPQSARHIYRDVLVDVLIAPGPDGSHSDAVATALAASELEKQMNEGSSVPSDPQAAASLAGAGETREVRQDIIRFYNAVFLPALHSYIKRFLISYSMLSGKSSHLGQPHLSPMPNRHGPASAAPGGSSEHHLSAGGGGGALSSAPRKIANNKNVFVSPAKAAHVPISPKRLTFTVNSSPSKDLRDINAMIAQAATKMKGGLSFSSSGGIAATIKRSDIGSSATTISGSSGVGAGGSGYFSSSTPSMSLLDRSGVSGTGVSAASVSAAKRMKFE